MEVKRPFLRKWMFALVAGVMAACLWFGLSEQQRLPGPSDLAASAWRLIGLAVLSFCCGIMVTVGAGHLVQRRPASEALQENEAMRAAQEALLHEKELLATTLASIGDAVIVTDS